MSNKIHKDAVRSRLKEVGWDYQEIQLASDYAIIVTAYGGRIFGPFAKNDESPSLFWINPAFESSEAFKQMLTEGFPLGGERLWISPEIQYGARDRADFWGTLHVPQSVDPGSYLLQETRSNTASLETRCSLNAYNLSSGSKELELKREIGPTADPLSDSKRYETIPEKLSFFGYHHTVTLSDLNYNDTMSEAWSLIQLNPGGKALVPSIHQIDHCDFFDPVPETHYKSRTTCFSASLDGKRQFKLGFPASATLGRIGYIHRLSVDDAYIIVRNYFNTPSSPYAEEPPAAPGKSGFSSFLYNDDGRFGGFAEIENVGLTIGGISGRSTTTDRMETWIYRGSPDAVGTVATLLLGADASQSV